MTSTEEKVQANIYLFIHTFKNIVQFELCQRCRSSKAKKNNQGRERLENERSQVIVNDTQIRQRRREGENKLYQGDKQDL